MPDQELTDPLLLALANAPEDDEPWTDEDEAAVAESRADFAAGRTLSHEELLQKYGLGKDDTRPVPSTDLADSPKTRSAENTAFATRFANQHRATLDRLAQ